MTLELTVDVQNASRSRNVPARAEIEAWVALALARHAEQVARELTVRIVDRAEGTALNQDYRGAIGPTNVLSFPFQAPAPLPGEATRLLGDVVICMPVVSAEARAQGKPCAQHFAHLVIHGVLHLLGYDHEIEPQALRMEALERELLAELGIPDPYAPTSAD